jgi:hypothetical protein
MREVFAMAPLRMASNEKAWLKPGMILPWNYAPRSHFQSTDFGACGLIFAQASRPATLA